MRFLLVVSLDPTDPVSIGSMLTRRAFLAALFGAVAGAAAWNLQRFEPPTVPALRLAADASTTPTVGAAPTTTTTEPRLVRLEVIGRDGWGAAASGELGSHTIEKVTFHHTGSALTDNRLAPFRMRDHQAYHQQQGWPDLAYHFVIDRNGHVYEGRPIGAPGDTSTDYDPAGHFLPVLDGNFDEQEPTEAQLAALAVLMAWAVEEFDLRTSAVGTHRDYASTACPGSALYGRLGDLLGRMHSVRSIGPVELVLLRGDEAVARVADIETGVV